MVELSYPSVRPMQTTEEQHGEIRKKSYRGIKELEPLLILTVASIFFRGDVLFLP